MDAPDRTMNPMLHNDGAEFLITRKPSMKSAGITTYTRNVNDIRVYDLPVPEPGPGQIRVRMRISPVNPSDLNFLHGTYNTALQRVIWNQGNAVSGQVYYDPDLINPCPQPPFALGGEGMGIVDATGSGWLARRLLGKRVAVASGPPNGTWQQYAVVDAMRAVALPAEISDEQGAMFFINPVTAYVLTREVLRLPRGAWLLLTAAGSALGKSIVRMAKLYGFKTLCVVRSGVNSDELRSLGADAVVETHQQDLIAEVFRITGGKGVSHALDCVGGDLASQVVRCLGLDGRLVLYGTLVDKPIQIPIRDLMMPVANISGFLLPNWMVQQSPLKLLGVLRQVRKLTIKGVFDTQVGQRFPLDQAADAVTASLQTGRAGKVILEIVSRRETG
jgi:NADPH:quinone reductase-like Zn-dependent oxidoreductase